MKTIQLFYLKNCPYCRRAFACIDNLKQQDRYKSVEIELIEENEQAELADQYDYYFVPTFYLDGKKVHEGIISENKIELIFKEALE